MDLRSCLYNKGYTLTKVLKQTKEDKVLKLAGEKVAKVKILSLDNKSPTQSTIKTEGQALRYLSGKAPFFPRYHETIRCKPYHIIVMEYIPGKPLIEFDNAAKSIEWWKDLIRQLTLITAFLEAHRILHNDFWDANIIISPVKKPIEFRFDGVDYLLGQQGFLVKLVDYQYTHQYTKKPKIFAPFVATRAAGMKAEKRRLGWSSRFNSGNDLNQALGLISDYPKLPQPLKKWIKSIVKKNKYSSDFIYAIDDGNKKTTPKKVLTSSFL